MKFLQKNIKNKVIVPFLVVFMFLIIGSLHCKVCNATDYPKKDIKGDLIIYTVMYKWAIDVQRVELKEAFPNLDIEFFKLGTQKLIAKIEAEIQAGGSQADIVMPLDTAWTRKMTNEKRLLKYVSPNSKDIPDNQKDKDGYWCALRFCAPVIVYNKNLIEEAEVPKTWLEVTDPKYKGKVAMGNPTLSGTFFGLTAQLSHRYGWNYFDNLRANNVVVLNSNGPVQRAVQAGEFPIGLVLEENILTGRKKGVTHVGIVYPSDGVVIERGDIMILKTSKNLEAAKAVYDWFLAKEGQTKTITSCQMRSPIYPMPGAPSFKELSWTPFQETPDFVEYTDRNHKYIKDQFSKIMLAK